MSDDLARRPVRGGPAVTELGFGAASIGNLYQAIDDEQSDAAVEAAWAAGIRYYDTAPHYGLGLSERRLGRILRLKERSEFVVSTKVGRMLVPRVPPSDRDDEPFEVAGGLTRQWDFSPDGIRRSLEASLERLQLDRIDIALLHDPDVSGIPGAAAIGAAALIALREEGLIRSVGIGSNSATAVTELFRIADIDTAMLAGRYTLMERDAEKVFTSAGGRSVLIAGAFNSGLLSTDRPTEKARYDYAPAGVEALRHATALAHAAEAHGATLPQAAIAFPLRHPNVASVVLGMDSAAQVERNVSLYRTPVPHAAWPDLLRSR